MIAALKRAYAAFRGFDDETGSAPMMDGPLRPNALLDAAPVALSLADVDNLTQHLAGFSVRAALRFCGLRRREVRSTASDARAFEQAVTFVAAGPSDSLAIGLDGRGVLILEGPHAGKTITEAGGQPLRSPTAGLFIDADTLIVANGAGPDSRRLEARPHGAGRNRKPMAYRSVRARPDRGADRREARVSRWSRSRGRRPDTRLGGWRHRLLDFGRGINRAGSCSAGSSGLPRPHRAAAGGGYWLALFAPRNQLTEFVLREGDIAGRISNRSGSGSGRRSRAARASSNRSRAGRARSSTC